MDNNLIIVFVAIISSLIILSNAEYSDCGSSIGTVDAVTVSGCEESEETCTLHRNSNVTITIKFTPKKDVKQLKAIVHGIIMDAPVPFPLPNSNGCVDSGVTCPIQANVQQSYFTSLPVLKTYPRIAVKVKFELKNEGDEDLTCSIIPSKIK